MAAPVNPAIPAPPGALAAIGQSLAPIVNSTPAVTTSSTGQVLSYTLVVQVPLPFLNINIGALAANFVLAELSKLGIPKAISFLVTNMERIINNVVEDAASLILAVPQVSILIQVRVGQVTVINVQVVAERTPVTVPLPTFVLGLPNFNFNFDFVVPLSKLPPVLIRVPIPVPVLALPKPLVAITGGQVSAEVNVVPAPNQAAPITNPIHLPQI